MISISSQPLPDSRIKDLRGKRFSRLTVIEHVGSKKTKTGTIAKWKCICECGNTCIVPSNNLKMKSGATHSCGCLSKESAYKNLKKGQDRKTHGLTNTSTYNSWRSMIQRCDNPNSPAYKNYGGRGITYPTEWKDFNNFFEDMGQRPSREYSIDRIDNDKSYSTDNCKWSTYFEQNNNKRDNVQK